MSMDGFVLLPERAEMPPFPSRSPALTAADVQDDLVLDAELGQVTEFHKHLIERLRVLDTNWDGHEGLPPHPHCITSAVRRLVQCRENLRPGTPDVMPTPAGGVMLEWESDLGALMVEYLPDEDETYSVQTQNIEEEGPWTELSPHAQQVARELMTA